ncbi:ATP-dependent DNA helicase pfh1-like isoform X1 [Rhizophagus irregularis DAOM 181602=DAOM 197198]|nr:ATP-dependent DNA helicase pfh1-like isoform X1 [Rhizophagus irregularis DAOM 181602=DAOM 197198]
MVRYRDLLSLTENHTLSWIDLYNQHLVEINDDSNDLIGPAVDDIQEVEEITTGLTKVCCDILKLKRQKASSSRQLVTTSIDLRTLSEKQRLIRERVESIAPLRIIVMGTAGTGKSYLINAIRGRLYEIVKEHNLHENNMVVAPTGVNIEGNTIRSSLSVPIFGVNVELEGESLKRLQRKLKYIGYFIVW